MTAGAALRRPTLSFAVTAGGPAARLRALLELVRPHVDEIVLAVDRAGDPRALEACADLADERLSYALEAPPSELIGWIRSRCSGDWILHLDDDELPSAALLDALPDLMAQRRPLGFGLLRRWVHGSGDRYVASVPWSVESLERLIRNVPGAWRFDGRVHTTPRATAELRHVDLAFYHLDLVAQPLPARRAKAVTYEILQPGIEFRGLAANALYIPEAFEDLETAPVPPEDVAAIEALLAPAPVPERPRPRAPVQPVEPEEIDAFTERARLPARDYRASLHLPDPPRALTAGASHPVALTVRNRGSTPWPWGADVEPLVRVGYRWRRADTAAVELDGRWLFPETVRPGRESLLVMTVDTPAEIDDYVLDVDLVHEHVRWFGCGVRLPVRIEPRRRAGLASARIPPGFIDAELEAAQASLSAELERATARRRAAEERLQAIGASAAHRIGRALARPLDTVRDLAGRARRAPR